VLLRQNFYSLAWAIDLTRSAHYAVFFIHDFRPSRLFDAENRQRTYFHTQFVNIAKTLCVIHDYSDHGFCLRWIEFQMLLSISRTVLALHVQASSKDESSAAFSSLSAGIAVWVVSSTTLVEHAESPVPYVTRVSEASIFPV